MTSSSIAVVDDYQTHFHLNKLTQNLQRQSTTFWSHKYLERLTNKDKYHTFDAIVLGRIREQQYAIFIPEISLESNIICEVPLTPGRRIKILVDEVDPRFELLRLSLAN